MINNGNAKIEIQTEEVCHDGVCRPGGFAITDRAMEFCNFKVGEKIIDIGCGRGETVKFIRQKYGLSVFGVDINREMIEQGKEQLKEVASDILVEGDSKKLNFGNNEIAGALFECSFSKMEQQELVLEEAFRVLKPGGYIIISDFYARGTPAILTGLLGRVDTKEQLLRKIERHSFTIEIFEDYSMELKTMLGQMLFDYGCETLYGSLGASPTEMKRIKLSYCLVIAKKR